MKRITSMMAVLALVGCGGAPVDFKHGVPSQEMVNVAMPEKKTAPSQDISQVQQGLQNEPSGSVGLTRLAVGLVNGTTVWILGTLKAVTDTPATSIKGNVAVWGPYTPQLSPTTWKLTVTRSGNRNFSYVLEGKLKSQDDTAYQAVLSGTHTASVDAAGRGVPGYGKGDFLIDWKALASVGGDQTRKSGSAEVTYGHELTDAATTVDVDFNEIPATGGTATETVASYHYKASPTGGEFSYATDLNAHWWDPQNPVMQHWTIKSRWTAAGAGRADAILTGGDLKAPATQNECWDDDFLSQYLYKSYDTSGGWGSASACTFADAQYAQ